MDFCILSPVSGLERYATLSRTHLLLPQLDKLKGYREFYKRMSARGDTLILDNGAYEGKEDWQDLLECIKIYQPNVVALPDYLLQPWDKTVTAALNFLDRYHDHFPFVKWMFIPQSRPRDIIGWVYGLETAMRDGRISYIGLPRALTYEITNDLFMRVNCAKTVRSLFPQVKIHALGMAKGSIDELNALKQLGCVSSVDSNAPVWRGYSGYCIEDAWPEIPCNYEYELPPTPQPGWKELRDKKILHNLEACGVDTTSVRARSDAQRKEASGS